MGNGRSPLFTGHVRLPSVFARWREGAFSRLNALSPVEIVAQTSDLLVERIIDQTTDSCPRLSSWTGNNNRFINEYGSPVVEFQLRASVEGNKNMLLLWQQTLQKVDAESDGNDVVIATLFDGRDPEKIRDELERRCRVVEQNVEIICRLINEEKNTLRQGLASELEKLRLVFEQGDETYRRLALPLVRDPAPPPSPLRIQERVVTHREASTRNVAEAAKLTLEERSYEEIMEACASMANTIKRSPRTFGRFWSQAKKPQILETPFRDVFLVGLNASFKGNATGETFNFLGKTDIVIRPADQNLFIAELKVWTGPASYAKAIQQVLGYVTWDDTKAAVIIFVGRQNYSDALAEIQSVTESHEACLRVSDIKNSGQWIRWIAKHPQDDQRRVTITTLTLNIPDTTAADDEDEEQEE